MEFNSIQHFFSQFHSLSSHPLFSTIVTLHSLILLYAPSLFLKIALSPVLNSTGIILLFLLKLGANERSEQESNHSEPKVLDHKDKHYEQVPLDSSIVLDSTSLERRFLELVDRNQTESESHQMKVEFERDLGLESYSKDAYSMESTQEVEKEEIGMEMESNEVDTMMEFLEWNMKAPLEIIYEEYEGEEEDDDDDDDSNGINMVSSDKHVLGLERYPSLSMYYPESETDSSPDDDFLMNENWESYKNVLPDWEDDDREELIEISVDQYNKRIEFCHAEEDNLIEIDIFPKRY